MLDVLNKLAELESCYIPSTKEVICGECDNKYEKLIQIEKLRCPKCRRGLMEEIRIEDKPVKVSETGGCPEIMGTPYKVPIHSDALALTPGTVAEHKEKFPDIEIDSELRPVFTNAKQHDDYMNKCGIRKQTQKIGRSKSKIYSYPGSKCS